MNYPTRKEEMVLLAVFRLKREASLVSIREYLSQTTRSRWTVGNTYVTLDRLERQKLLESNIGEPEARRGGKAVKFYRLSIHGRLALRELKKVQDILWAGVPSLFPESRNI
jgi:PadR family transcriptional regulator PadR